MKKMFGKKGTNSLADVLHCDDDEFAQKECEVLKCDSRKSEEGCFSEASKTFCLCFDNPDFRECDSNIFSNINNQASTTTRCISETLRQEIEMNSTQSVESSFNELNGAEPKNSISLKSGKPSKSRDSLDQLSHNLVLKKTEEISNFNYKNFEEMANVQQSNRLQRKVKRLVEQDEEKLESSDNLVNKIETNKLNDIDLIESRTNGGNKFIKKLYTFQFKNKWTRKKCPIKSQRTKNDTGFWSMKSLNKTRIVNFFSQKNEKTNKRSKFTQLNLTVKEDNKPKILRERFVDPEVPLKEDLETKKYFKDFYFFIIYLIILTTVAMSMTSANMYYFTNLTTTLLLDSENIPSLNTSNVIRTPPQSKNGLKTLRNIHTIGDFWKFAETTLIDVFYWKFFYQGKRADDSEEEGDRKMFYENQILGVPRLRQVRVKKNSCLIHPDFKKYFRSCYHQYSPLNEETEPIKEGMESFSTATAWVYTNAKKLKTSYYWGEISIYGGGGYYLDLALNKEKAKEMIEELKENVWLSRATRAVFIDFNLYNANVNLFCICKIVLEFPPAGGIIPKADFHTLKLVRYITTFDFFVLGCEFLLILFILYFTWELIEKLNENKTNFFLSFWNYVDLALVLLLYIFIILSITRYLASRKLVKQLDDHFYKYTEFAMVKEVQINFNNVIAVLMFASWIKFISFLKFNKLMLKFKKTLKRSLRGILGFLPMFITTFLAFTFLANLLFGNQVKEYSTVWLSSLSLLQAFLGEFKYGHIQKSNRILGPIFYIAFIFFLFFVLLNVFIAIIHEAYSKVKSEVMLIAPQVGNYVKRGFINLMTCCQPRKKLKQKTSLKKKFVFQKICTTLEKAGFTKDEIKIFFTKYNVNIGSMLDDNTRKKIMESLEFRRFDFGDSSKQTQLNFLRRKMDNLNFRVEDIEASLTPVIDKVDILIDRLSSKKYS